jgi:hypothetical protein
VISIVTLIWAVPYIFYADKLSRADRWMLGIVWLLGFTLAMISIYTIKVCLWRALQKAVEY